MTPLLLVVSVPESPEMWTALNSIALAVVAVFYYLGNKRAVKNRKASDVKITQVGNSVSEVGRQVTQVKEAMNGPVIDQLGVVSRLSARVAELTSDPADRKAAVDAESNYQQALKRAEAPTVAEGI